MSKSHIPFIVRKHLLYCVMGKIYIFICNLSLLFEENHMTGMRVVNWHGLMAYKGLSIKDNSCVWDIQKRVIFEMPIDEIRCGMTSFIRKVKIVDDA